MAGIYNESYFIFNDIPSNAFDVFLVSFDNGGLQENSTGSIISLNTDKLVNDYQWSIYNTEYKQPLSFKLTFAKTDFSKFISFEQREIQKWLFHKNEYKWLQIAQHDLENVYYRCIATEIHNCEISGRNIGMTVLFTCDSPFGWSAEYTKSYEISSPNQVITFKNESDEYDYLYPKMKINMKSPHLSIVNQTDKNREFRIENRNIEEVIEIDNKLQTFPTKNSGIFNSFNKKWFRFNDRVNTLVCNGNSTLTFTYRFIRKVGI